jgi:hypothetical protein
VFEAAPLREKGGWHGRSDAVAYASRRIDSRALPHGASSNRDSSSALDRTRLMSEDRAMPTPFDALPGAPWSAQVLRADLDLLSIEFHVGFSSESLLRKGGSKARRRRLQDAFEAEARSRAELFRFRPFKADVAVQVDIHAPGHGQQPLMPDVVKAHLDALEGIAYDNDRQVGHLLVHRHAWDHPMLGSLSSSRSDDEEAGKLSVFVSVGLLAAYTRLYDRMFRREIFRRNPHSPVRTDWRVADELRLGWKKGQARGAASDSFEFDEELRLLGRSMLGDIDRPGPLSVDMRRAFKVFPAHRVQRALRASLGATFVLPLAGQGPGSSDRWVSEVDSVFERHRQRRGMARASLKSFVALDIAARGESLHGKDLDNLARGVVDRFERAFCIRPGTVSCYRVYRAVGTPRGVQVRVMSESRMLALEIALGETRAEMVQRLDRLDARTTTA